MDAVVEVGTATVATVVHRAAAVAKRTFSLVWAFSVSMVPTSTLRVLSIGGTSLSAVSPDYIFKNGGLAWA